MIEINDLIFKRHSVRSFSPKSLPAVAVKALRAAIQDATTHDVAIHFQLFTDDDKPFRGFNVSYGMFRNPCNYVACVVDTSYPDAMQRLGFYAEKLALTALKHGLGSCFVGGTFNSKAIKAQLRVTWSIPCILLVGIPEGSPPLMAQIARRFIAKHKPASDLLSPESTSWDKIQKLCPRITKALEAAAAAPSALNKHPLNFTIQAPVDSAIAADLTYWQVSARASDEGIMPQIDLGAAMYNFNVIIPEREWEYGDPAQLI